MSVNLTSRGKNRKVNPDDVPPLTPDGLFIIGSAVGSGGQGVVFLGRHLSTGQIVAIKICGSSRLVQTKREVDILSILQHPSILSLMACSVDVELGMTFLVFELCSGGELFNKIVQSPSGRFPEHVAQYYFRSLVEGVAFMHRKGVAHRDIKPENLLLTGNHELRISDFGLSRMSVPQVNKSKDEVDSKTHVISNSLSDMAQSFCGSLHYMAPEVCQCVWKPAPYSTKGADIWSAGMLLYVMLAGGIPWKRALPVDLGYQKLLNGSLTFPSHLSQDAVNVLKACLQPDASARLSADEILLLPWLNSTHATTLPKKEMDVLARSVSGDPSERPSQAEYVECGWIQTCGAKLSSSSSSSSTTSTTSTTTTTTTTTATSTASSAAPSSTSASTRSHSQISATSSDVQIDGEDQPERAVKRQRISADHNDSNGHPKTETHGTTRNDPSEAKSTTTTEVVDDPLTGDAYDVGQRPELHVGRVVTALGWHAIKHDTESVRNAVVSALATLNLSPLVQDNKHNSEVEILVMNKANRSLVGVDAADAEDVAERIVVGGGELVVKDDVTLTEAERAQSMKSGALVCIVRVLERADGVTIHISRPCGDLFAFHNLYKKLRVLLVDINSGAR